MAPKRGRPPLARKIVDFIIKAARTHHDAGCPEIRDMVRNNFPDNDVPAISTIGEYLQKAGIPRAKRRRIPVRAWLANLWKLNFATTAACDFFTITTPRLLGRTTWYVLIVIKFKTREIRIVGITKHPHTAFMRQAAYQMTNAFDGCLRGMTVLIRDGDQKFTDEFAQILKAHGITTKKTPPHAPNCNAYAERVIRTIKEEYLSRLPPLLHKRAIETALNNFVDYYHHGRHHQGIGIDGRILKPDDTVFREQGQIVGRPYCHGMFTYYHRQAA